MAKTGKRLPISALKTLGTEHGYTHVIVFAFDQDTGIQSVATWGKTIAQCQESADLGNKIKRGLGWPADLCNTQPRRAKRKVTEDGK